MEKAFQNCVGIFYSLARNVLPGSHAPAWESHMVCIPTLERGNEKMLLFASFPGSAWECIPQGSAFFSEYFASSQTDFPSLPAGGEFPWLVERKCLDVAAVLHQHRAGLPLVEDQKAWQQLVIP
ncbi:hypothetical protein BuS5_02622 [Desulfosarcina sp. BuS5]|nr:hypothetical protein BuS5_02622 [Desulfosarcina sp. BuS5]